MKRTPWILLALSTLAGPLVAQLPPHPNGCSVPGLPGWADQGLDTIFLEACDTHDRCWARCNGPDAPFLDHGHKAECDLNFLVQMETACVIESAGVVFPLGGLEDTAEFLEACSTVAGTFYASVATPLTNFIFDESQCRRGCNPDFCQLRDIPFPDACGEGQCYTNIPPPDPCLFVNCGDPRVCDDFRRWCCPDDCHLPGEDPQCGEYLTDPKAPSEDGAEGRQAGGADGEE